MTWPTDDSGVRSSIPLIRLEAAIWSTGTGDIDFWSELGQMLTMDQGSGIFQLGTGWGGGGGSVSTMQSGLAATKGKDEGTQGKDYFHALAMGSSEYYNLKQRQQASYRRHHHPCSYSQGAYVLA